MKIISDGKVIEIPSGGGGGTGTDPNALPLDGSKAMTGPLKIKIPNDGSSPQYYGVIEPVGPGTDVNGNPTSPFLAISIVDEESIDTPVSEEKVSIAIGNKVVVVLPTLLINSHLYDEEPVDIFEVVPIFWDELTSLKPVSKDYVEGIEGNELKYGNYLIPSPNESSALSYQSGVPVGSIIPFMGTTPPEDYLACEGQEVPLIAYPELAKHFETQFGSMNHFGGDGLTAFALPDLRDMFLRGYHGENEGQLSGEIGVKQEATEIPHVLTGLSSTDVGIWSMVGPHEGSEKAENVDRVVSETQKFGGTGFLSRNINNDPDIGNIRSYTTRPVNVSVLYIIKARPTQLVIPKVVTQESQGV